MDNEMLIKKLLNGPYFSGAREAMEEAARMIKRLSLPRNPPFVSEWHARAVALGYDGVADMLDSVERGEPPLHVAEVMARASSSAV